MPARRAAPPWDYLRDASIPSLQSYELSRLNHAANLRREVGALVDQWIEDAANALLARWMCENRVEARPAVSQELTDQPELPFGNPLEPPSTDVVRTIRSVRRSPRASSDR